MHEFFKFITGHSRTRSAPYGPARFRQAHAASSTSNAGGVYAYALCMQRQHHLDQLKFCDLGRAAWPRDALAAAASSKFCAKFCEGAFCSMAARLPGRERVALPPSLAVLPPVLSGRVAEGGVGWLDAEGVDDDCGDWSGAVETRSDLPLGRRARLMRWSTLTP